MGTKPKNEVFNKAAEIATILSKQKQNFSKLSLKSGWLEREKSLKLKISLLYDNLGGRFDWIWTVNLAH